MIATEPALLDAVAVLAPHRDLAVAEQAALLYAQWYARPVAPAVRPAGFPRDLVQVLRAADAAGDRWSDGWTIRRVAGNGRVIAQRRRDIRLADRCDVIVPGRVGLLPKVGDTALIADRHDHVDEDGWWRTASATWPFVRPLGQPLVRMYWNVGLETLPALVGALTALLGTDTRPWMLKSACDPAAHCRADATVLFAVAELVEQRRRELDAIADDFVDAARAGAPPLTLRCRPGLAIAVDPGGDESFGEHRCRLIAEALCDTEAPGDPLARIARRYAADGIGLARPFTHRGAPRIAWETDDVGQQWAS
jgi:hypothetical protein